MIDFDEIDEIAAAIPKKRGGRGAEVPTFGRAAADLRRAPRRAPERRSHRYVYRCATCGHECNGPAQFCDDHLRITLRP